MTAAEWARRPVIALAAIVVVAAGARCLAIGSSSAVPLPPNGSEAPSVTATGSTGATGANGGGSNIPAASAVKVTPPQAPTGAVVTAPASIVSDCSVDVTAALQAWIDSVPDNSTLRFGHDACYRSDEVLRFADRNRLVVDGNGATLKAIATGSRGRAQLVLSGGSELTVRDLTARGANPEAGATVAAYNPDLEAQHGFVVGGATDVLLDHVQAYDTYGDFVYIGPGKLQDRGSRNVTVANSRFARSGRQGISITWGVNVAIEGNTITDVARSVFDFEANSGRAEIRNIRIAGNVTGRAVNFWLANKGFAADIGNVSITGNRMAAPTGGLIFVYTVNHAFRGPFLVEHNQFAANDVVHDEGSSGAFFFAHVSQVVIRDNQVSFPSGKAMPAVELRDAHHVEITGNRFPGAGRTVISSLGSTDVRAS